MSKYIKDTEAAHLWVNGQHSGQTRSQDWGTAWGCRVVTGHGSRVSFDGDRFYSYDTCVAKRFTRKKQDVYVLDQYSYSSTTNRHVQSVWAAVHRWTGDEHVETKPCFSINRGDAFLKLHDATPSDVLKHVVTEALEFYEKFQKTKHPSRHRALLSAAARRADAIRFAKLLGLKHKKAVSVLKFTANEIAESGRLNQEYEDRLSARRSAAWEKRRAARTEREAKIKEDSIADAEAFIRGDSDEYHYNLYRIADMPDLIAKIEARRAEIDRATIEDWLAGKVAHPKHDWPTMLRLKGDEIETSRGAIIPAKAGLKAYIFASALRANGKEWKRNGDKFEVGSYQLDAVNDKGIIAGCHHIHWAEVERFAKLMGWA